MLSQIKQHGGQLSGSRPYTKGRAALEKVRKPAALIREFKDTLMS